MRSRAFMALAGPPLALVLLLTGCASGDEDLGIASAGGDSQEAAASEEPLSDGESALEYTECLRENGLEVGDPDSEGRLQLRIPEDQAEVAEEAMAACEEFAPRVSEEQEAETRDEVLEFAQCMRENGVEAFEDPQSGGGISLTPEIADDPDFEEAQEACEGNLSGLREERGENAG
ncbi:hypothetical protein ACIBFB_25725 [Nocardiopsis sp. NPDC050513]|uniref:hypothetical protein n=1 Tax=Nocardiopsis sp. NPDC050513 TaxID=3364338 RepID=UPI0037ADB013